MLITFVLFAVALVCFLTFKSLVPSYAVLEIPATISMGLTIALAALFVVMVVLEIIKTNNGKKGKK